MRRYREWLIEQDYTRKSKAKDIHLKEVENVRYLGIVILGSNERNRDADQSILGKHRTYFKCKEIKDGRQKYYHSQNKDKALKRFNKTSSGIPSIDNLFCKQK